MARERIEQAGTVEGDMNTETAIWLLDSYEKELNALHTEKNKQAGLFRMAVIDACNYEFKEVSRDDLNADSKYFVCEGS